jgi:hypothetical protein
MFKTRSLSKEEEKLPFGGVLLPLDAKLVWPPDMEVAPSNARDEGEAEELMRAYQKPSLRFACPFILSIMESWRIVITSKVGNPFNWPAVVFLPVDAVEGFDVPDWLIDYNRNNYYIEEPELDPFLLEDYEEFVGNILTSLGGIISLQQSAMRYLQYYGVSVENIVSKYLELSKSVPSDSYATEAPPTGVYLWSFMSKGKPRLLNYDLSKPINATEFFAVIEALKEHYDVADIRELPEELVEKIEDIALALVIPLPDSNDLQNLLRLGDLYIRPSEVEVGIVRADVSINPRAKKILDSNKAEPYELATAIFASLGKPLVTAYKSIPRELTKEAKEQRHKVSRRLRAYDKQKSWKDAP